jgi:uncharacterized protein with HEPN domain
MSERSDKLLLQDILEAIDKINTYISELTESQFQSDLKTQDAVSRNFMVIGEAVSKLSDSLRARHNNVPWRILKDFRNKIIHDYFGVDYSTVWTIIKKDLPSLKAQIESVNP